MLLSSLGTSIANVGLPTIARAFDASFQAVQWVVIAYLLAVTTLIVGAGRLGDLIGRRRLLVAGIALFTAASVACALAASLTQLVAARAVQGMGAAVMLSLTLAFVGDTVPKDRIGRAMGLLGTMSATGTALGPSLGGLLIAGFGWRALFVLNVPLGLAALALALRYLPSESRDAATARAGFDLTGTLLLALTLAAYALAVTLGRGSLGRLNLALLGAAVVGLGLFLFAESRVTAPLIQLAAFRDRTLRASLAMSVLVSTVMMSTLVVGPFYLSGALGLSATLTGFVLAVGPIVTALSGVPAGRMTDRFGAPVVTRVGLAGIATGSALLALLPAALGSAGYVGAIAVMTSGYGLFQTANNTAVMSGSRASDRGVMSGLLNLARNLGLVTGASAMAALFALASSHAAASIARPAAVAAGMHVTFAVAALLIVGALALAARPHALVTITPPSGGLT
jgi:MFS family permease